MAAYERVIADGEHVIAEYFPRQAELLAEIRKAILEGISLIAGDEAAANVDQAGLTQMHRHFAPEFLPFLVRFMAARGRAAALTATHQIGAAVMEIAAPFYIDENVVYRFHYPHLTSITSKLRRDAYLKLDLNDFRGARRQLEAAFAAVADQPVQMTRRLSYHRNLPVAAWILGAHKDTWFGHTFDAMNVWWSIAGVTQKNGLILYSDLFGIDLPHDNDPEVVAPGMVLPEPQKIALKDGAVIVFNADVLHGTQLNIDEITRIVVTGRINPNRPQFYGGTAAAEYPNWHLSSDVEAGRYDEILRFPRADNLGKGQAVRAGSYAQVARQVTVNRPIKAGPVEICEQAFLPVGEKMLVRLPDAQVIVVRNAEGLRAVSALCPHIGVNLIDGHHNERSIFCPGHGVEFDLKDGSSACAKLRLRRYEATIAGGMITLAEAARL